MSVKLEAGQWYRTRGGEICYCIGSKPVNKAYQFVFSDDCGNMMEYTQDGHYWENLEQDDRDIVEHLPNCTGFDWDPPKRPDAPDGWRWIEDYETIQDGDHYWNKRCKDGNPFPDQAYASVGQTWGSVKSTYKNCWGVLRKIEPKLQLREGAWYEREDGEIVGPCEPRSTEDRAWAVGGWRYDHDGTNSVKGKKLVREVDPPKPPQPKYRPFKDAEEFKPFRDSWLMSTGTDAITGGFERVISYDDHRVYVTIGECTDWWSYKNAMERFTFDDGSPFGVLDDQ